MRDSERGVVWEETIILLPDNVRYVFLSATIPNAKEFAQWICHLHKQPCNVVYTDYRFVFELENHTLINDLDQHLSNIIFFHVVEMAFILLLMINESSMIMNLKMQ